MSVSSPVIVGSLASVVLVAALAGCGGSPTQSRPATGGEGQTTAAERVYAEYAEMPAGQERTDALVSACQEEGELVVNSAASILPALLPTFEKEYGIEVQLVEPTSSEAQRQRVLQEHQAGRVRADLLITYAADLSHIYAEEGVTAEYASPVTAQLDERVQSERYIALWQLPVVPQRNTELVAATDAPSSYAELADPRWKGQLGLVRGDGNWYFTLYDYFTNEGGMSDAEFEEMFRGIAENARAFDGHGTASLVAAGEVPLLVNGFQLYNLDLVEEGSPISADPPLEPIVMLRFASGMVTTAENPACAVLFSEWVITDGQELVIDNNYYPVNVHAIADVPFSVEEHELAHIPVDEIDAETFGQWQRAFDNLTSGNGDILP